MSARLPSDASIPSRFPPGFRGERAPRTTAPDYDTSDRLCKDLPTGTWRGGTSSPRAGRRRAGRGPAARPCAHLVEEPRDLLCRPAPAEGPYPLQSALAEVLAQVRVGQHPVHRVREIDGVVGIHAEGGVTADLRQGGAARGDDRGAAGHSLEDRQAEALAQ